MIPRLFTTSSRISLTTTVRFLKFSARNTAKFGGNNAESMKFVGNGLVNAVRSIKGRLLAPSSKRPLIIGAAAVAGTAVYGVSSLIYYSFNPQDDSILQNSNFWSDAVRKNVFNTYSYFFASLGITTATAIAATRSPAVMRFYDKLGLLSCFACMVVCVVAEITCIETSFDNKVAKHASWVTTCALFGAFMAPLGAYGAPVLIRAAWYTAGIVAGLSTTAIIAPSEKYLTWFAPLHMSLGVIIVASLGDFFLPKIPPKSVLATNLTAIVFLGGLVVFSLLLLHDTQRLVNDAVEHDKRSKRQDQEVRSFDPINAQLPIFFDVINLFIRIVTLCTGNIK